MYTRIMVATLEYKHAEPLEAESYASPLCCTYSETHVSVQVHTPEPSEAHKNQYVAFGNCPVMFRDWSGLCPEGERDVDWGYFEDYSLIDRLRGNTPKVLVIRDARPRIGMPVGNPIQFAFALQDAYNRSSFAPEPLPDYIKIGMLPAPSHLLGRGYPTKLNRAGQLQPYDPATGHYLSHSANPGAVMSPAGRFGAGFAQGWAESKGASGASPVGSAGKLGYALGNLFGSLF